MAGFAERGLDAVGYLHGALIAHLLEQGQRRLDVGGRIERDHGMRPLASLAFVAFAFVFGVFFLEPGRVEHDDLGDLRGRGRAVNRAGEAVFDKLGQQAAMVQMGVRQQNRVNTGGREIERVPVALLELPLLIETAIDEQPRAVDFEHVTGTGDILGTAQEA